MNLTRIWYIFQSINYSYIYIYIYIFLQNIYIYLKSFFIFLFLGARSALFVIMAKGFKNCVFEIATF
jgi:hypothetical protein